MGAPRKRWFQNLKDKTSKMLKKKRQRQAPDKESEVKEIQNSQLPPLSTSEDSEMSNCETTVDLPKPLDDQTTAISIKEQCSTTSGQWFKHSFNLSKVFFL